MANRSEELLALLDELARLTVLDEGDPQSFRARAYENAVQELRATPGDLSSMTEKDLVGLDGVGKSTARKIREFFETGRIEKLERLRADYPPEVQRLAKLPGLGPKTLSRLRDLGIEDVAGLRRAIDAREIRVLRGLGPKTEERLRRALDRMAVAGEDRSPIAEVMPVARRLAAELEGVPGVLQVRVCGSLRRLLPTIGDVDLLVAARDPRPVMEHFFSLPPVREVLGRGETRSSIVTDRGLQVDLRVVAPEQIGAALLYFTGSKAHNIRLRQLALAKGWTLNEYGLADTETGAVVASRSEEEIYRALGLSLVPAPMREDTGEIEASAAGELPEALSPKHLRGDLHVHTDLSGDGRSPIEAILEEARAREYSYLAITDHGEDLRLNGVSRERLLEQRDHMHRLQHEHPGMRLLHGVELNIGPEGGLDYDVAFRRSFDWCVAAVHSHFELDRSAQTRRVLTAMRDPAVNVIGHLTGRMIGRRPGIELDVDAVLREAARTRTAIEINSALPRLDAAWEVLRKAEGLGVVFVVSTDAHHVDELDRTRWGARQAQRGWIGPDAIANTWPAERFHAWNAERRGEGG